MRLMKLIRQLLGSIRHSRSYINRDAEYAEYNRTYNGPAVVDYTGEKYNSTHCIPTTNSTDDPLTRARTKGMKLQYKRQDS